jgi:hypothetical protein
VVVCSEEESGGAVVKACIQIPLKDVLNTICIQAVDGEAICVIFETDLPKHNNLASSTPPPRPSPEAADSLGGRSEELSSPPSSDASTEGVAPDELETMVCGWDQGQELLVTISLHDNGGAGLNVKQVGDFILIDPVAPFYPMEDGQMGKPVIA